MRKIKCPRCIEEMGIATYGEIVIRECVYCEGAWIPYAELQKLDDGNNRKIIADHFHPANASESSHGGSRSCPTCEDENLVEVQIQGVMLDICPKCSGVFFDEGELLKVMPDANKSNEGDDVAKYFGLEALYWLIFWLLLGR